MSTTGEGNSQQFYTIEAIDKIIEKRLKQLGIRITRCKRCGKEIFWIETGNHKRSPVCLNLISHFADCPYANDFRKNAS